MKIFALVCLFFAFVSAEYVIKTDENAMQYRDECVDELLIPNLLVEQYKKMEYPDDVITHCYMKCILNKFELFNDETGFQTEHLHMQVVGSDSTADHDDVLHDNIESCIDKNEQGSNTCEWAYRGAMCLYKHNLQLTQQTGAEEEEEELITRKKLTAYSK